MAKTKVPNIVFENCKFLIKKFLKPNNINYAREVKIAKQLLSLYPETCFWENFTINFELNSLAFFLGEGAKHLREKYKLVSLDLPQQPIYDENNSNQLLISFSTTKKRETVKEFLN